VLTYFNISLVALLGCKSKQDERFPCCSNLACHCSDAGTWKVTQCGKVMIGNATNDFFVFTHAMCMVGQFGL
jgi:hypothetical protein